MKTTASPSATRRPPHPRLRHTVVLLLALAGLVPALAPTARADSGGDGNDDDDEIITIQYLTSTGSVSGKAKARLRVRPDGTDFEVELENSPQGTYAVYVADVFRGDIVVDGFSEAELEFETPLDPPKPLLDFDVAEQVIEIRQDGSVLYSDVFGSGGSVPGDDDDDDDDPDDDSSSGNGNGNSAKLKLELPMAAVGPDANARGRLRYRRKSSSTRFKINLEKLDGGTYELWVGGVLVETLAVPDELELEVEFRDPPEAGTLPLDFQPLGQQVDVARDGVIYLSAVMPGSPEVTGAAPPRRVAKDLGGKQGDALRVALARVSAGSGGEGTVELEKEDGGLELEVEVEDLPTGLYGVAVDDVLRGELLVGSDGAGRIVFAETPEGDELLLDFPVKRRVLEVKSGPLAVLAVVVPGSVDEALGRFPKEKISQNGARLDLVNDGVDLDARGRAVLRVTAKKTTLRIRAQDLPSGSHDVRVDGVIVGTLQIATSGGGATLRLSTAPKPKETLLEASVDGALVEVLLGGETELHTTLP